MTQSALAAEVLADIESFLSRSGMSPSYFGKKVGNSDIVSRLRDGGDIRTGTIDRVRAFIRENGGKAA